MTDNIKPFRVLSLDGGGMRGLYTAIILQRLVQLFDFKYKDKTENGDILVPDIGKSFDMICGTSTGAILACALANGVPINRIIQMYKDEGENIFPSPMPKNKIKKYWWSFGKHGRSPSANANNLKNALNIFFDNITIKNLYDARGIALCIPTINASNHKAWVFKTPHFKDKHRDNNYKLTDVCLASAAAPVFFPIASIHSPDIDAEAEQFFVDGGLWANNPIMVGLIEALALTPTNQPIEIISIGTCEMPTSDPSLLKSNLGVIDWEVGVGATEMSIASQAYGYSNMAKFLSKILCSLDKDLTVIRLQESQKSNKQLSAIGLDKADELAIKTLTNLALADADLNHSNVINDLEQKENQIIKDIFSNITELNI